VFVALIQETAAHALDDLDGLLDVWHRHVEMDPDLGLLGAQAQVKLHNRLSAVSVPRRSWPGSAMLKLGVAGNTLSAPVGA
jgi:hypothetical protein